MISFFFCLSLFQFTFVQCQNDHFDVEWDQNLIEKDVDFKCGIENKYQKGSTARIVNGEMATNKRYPWMAEVLLLIFERGSSLSTINYKSTGSIISDKAILTSAHNLCHFPVDDDDALCLTDIDQKPTNQNRLLSQIHYSIGNMKAFTPENVKKLAKDEIASYKKAVKAYIYKYEPNWWEEGTEKEKLDKIEYMKNGDIGLIIDESDLGLNLKLNKAIPICLPSQKTFEMKKKNNELKVTVVGRGRVYDELTDEQGFKKHSCMTNEGVVKKRGQEYAPNGDVLKESFLQCKYTSWKEDICLLMKNACIKKGNSKCSGYNHQLLSTSAEISFSRDSKGRRMRINIPRMDECQKLSKKVTNVIDKLDKWRQRIFKQDDGLGPSRILVLDKEDKDTNLREKYNEFKTQTIINSKGAPVPYCYNLKRLAKWGVCETEYDVYNFGFCSSSCKLKGKAPFQINKKLVQYLELTADFHEHWNDADDDYHSKYLK